MKKEYAKYPLKVSGIGYYIPENCISFENSEEISSENEKKAIKKLGIANKRCVMTELHSDMALVAIENALQMANMEADELDLILNISVSYEKSMPEPATMIQKKLKMGDSGIPCITVQSGDLGFISALDLCSAYINTNRYRNILIVSSEILSVITDKKCDYVADTLMADGAAAVIVTKAEVNENSGVYDALIKSVTTEDVYSAGYSIRMFEKMENEWDMCIRFNYDEFVKQGVELLNEVISEYQEKVNCDDVDVIIPLQQPIMYKKLNDRFKGKLVINESKEYGYSGTASIPFALCKCIQNGVIVRGSKILLLGVGAGIEAGAIMITY